MRTGGFEKIYGELGEGYIEVHHKLPLYSLQQKMNVNPQTDLISVCSNCHKMLHRNHKRMLGIDQLKKIICHNESANQGCIDM